MPKVLDDHNVHQFWGLSPPVDLAEAASCSTSDVSNDGPICILQVIHQANLLHNQHLQQDRKHINPCLQMGAYDCRHTALTLARQAQHLAASSQHMQLYIVEDEPEVLARHLLLLSVLLDRALPIGARVETFLELHGNALLQQRTAEYAGELLISPGSCRGAWLRERGLTCKAAWVPASNAWAAHSTAAPQHDYCSTQSRLHYSVVSAASIHCPFDWDKIVLKTFELHRCWWPCSSLPDSRSAHCIETNVDVLQPSRASSWKTWCWMAGLLRGWRPWQRWWTSAK